MKICTKEVFISIHAIAKRHVNPSYKNCAPGICSIFMHCPCLLQLVLERSDTQPFPPYQKIPITTSPAKASRETPASAGADSSSITAWSFCSP